MTILADEIKEHKRDKKRLQKQLDEEERKCARRTKKVQDAEEALSLTRKELREQRKKLTRVLSRHEDLIADRDELRAALVELQHRIKQALERSHLG